MKTTPNSTRWGRRIGWAIAIAIGLHVVAAILLFATPLRRLFTDEPNRPVAASSGDGDSNQNDSAEPTPPEPEPEQPVEPAEPKSPHVEPTDMRDQISRAVRDAEDAPPEENLNELARLTNRLDNVATEEGVNEIAEKMTQWTGTEKRASEPAAKPSEKPFDYNTAQLHEVKRIQGESGEWVYLSILVDANGNTTETEMDAETGKTAYDTMQIVKSSPFAEAVYRQIAMPMLDQIIETSKQAERLQHEMQRMEREAAQKQAEAETAGDATD